MTERDMTQADEDLQSQTRATEPPGDLAEFRTDLANERTEMAAERTDHAMQRSLLANERTFSAWFRTGLAGVVAGLGIVRLMGETGMPWISRAIGTIFILAGIMVFAMALWRYEKLADELRFDGAKVTPVWVLLGLVGAMIAAAVLAVILLFQV